MFVGTSHPLTNAYLLEVTLDTPRGERQTPAQLATNSEIYNDSLPARYTGAIVARSHQSNQPLSDWIKGPHQEMEPMPGIASVAKNLRLDRSWIKGKPKYYCSVKGT